MDFYGYRKLDLVDALDQINDDLMQMEITADGWDTRDQLLGLTWILSNVIRSIRKHKIPEVS